MLKFIQQAADIHLVDYQPCLLEDAIAVKELAALVQTWPCLRSIFIGAVVAFVFSNVSEIYSLNRWRPCVGECHTPRQTTGREKRSAPVIIISSSIIMVLKNTVRLAEFGND